MLAFTVARPLMPVILIGERSGVSLRRLPGKNLSSEPYLLAWAGSGSGLFLVERSLVDPAVLDSYERAFQQGLEALIQRTRDPELRRTFEGMRSCPVRDRGGRCNRFADYILGALVRNGCHHEYDIEDALQRIVFRMLSPVGESGKPRRTIFDFDANQPYDLRLGNPLEVRFKDVPAQRHQEHLRRQDSGAADKTKTGDAVHRLRQGAGRGLARGDPRSEAERRGGDGRRHYGHAEAAFDPGDAFGRPVPVDFERRGNSGSTEPVRAQPGRT